MYYVFSLIGEITHSSMSFSIQLQHKSSSRSSPSYFVPYPNRVLIEKFSCVSQMSNFFPHLLQVISLAIVTISFLYIKVVFYAHKSCCAATLYSVIENDPRNSSSSSLRWAASLYLSYRLSPSIILDASVRGRPSILSYAPHL